jgi:8-oxo-dGTP diphosphatase
VVVRVVGVALLRAGADGRRRLLGARRTRPPELAGRWELPGGKAREGESLEEAAVREVAEELGCRVRVTGSLAGAEPVRDGVELHVVTAELLDGVPTPTEHDALRWLSCDELDQVDWLAPDVPFLDELRARLGAEHQPGEERR